MTAKQGTLMALALPPRIHTPAPLHARTAVRFGEVDLLVLGVVCGRNGHLG